VPRPNQAHARFRFLRARGRDRHRALRVSVANRARASHGSRKGEERSLYRHLPTERQEGERWAQRSQTNAKIQLCYVEAIGSRLGMEVSLAPVPAIISYKRASGRRVSWRSRHPATESAHRKAHHTWSAAASFRLLRLVWRPARPPFRRTRRTPSGNALRLVQAIRLPWARRLPAMLPGCAMRTFRTM